MQSKKRSLRILFVIAFAVSAFVFTALKTQEFEIVKNLDIYSSLFKELNLFYVDEVDPGETVKKSIDEMLKSLDPYTVYIPESDIEDFKFMTTGQYGGIGALIRKRDDYVMISDPYEGFPAQKNGLNAGDILLEIDGNDLKEKTISQVSELLKGEPDTELKLKVKRVVSEKEEVVKIKREEVQISPVPFYGMLNETTGYVYLTSFTNKAASELHTAIRDLKENMGATSLVMDLRNNPGGLLVEAVKICNMFIPQNELVVSTKGKVEKWNKEYKAGQVPFDTEIPMVVLVNQGSASASEIVSGCLQDYDRAVVIGKRTFGKGLVQTTRDLSYNAKLKVTTAKYYIPSGRCIQALDYTHRNEDGSVGRVPDSLITEFETKNGRKVYDGGGILPDINVDAETLSKIATHLLIENYIFDYASQYVYENKEKPQLKGFELSDAEYDKFIAFINDKEFDFETRSEIGLEKLIETAKKEKYYDVAKEEFAALEAKIAHDREKDLKLFRSEIKEMIEQEIIGRYYYQKGQIEFNVGRDKTVAKALEVLSKDDQYAGILDGSIVLNSAKDEDKDDSKSEKK